MYISTKKVKLYGLIGQTLIHSFSERYFKQKFASQNLQDCDYRNFELPSIEDFPQLLELFPELLGVNVTMPYKKEIMKYLDFIDEQAKEVGAVNVVTIKRFPSKDVLKGYNTDIYGFESTMLNVAKDKKYKALVLGTGGASAAVTYVLKKLNIEYSLVSRYQQKDVKYTYKDLSQKIINEHLIIINTTPLGMYPHIDYAPEIPYNFLTNEHILIDLIYNPALTKFLKLGKQHGTTIINGQEMLIKQAEKTWEIFCSS